MPSPKTEGKVQRDNIVIHVTTFFFFPSLIFFFSLRSTPLHLAVRSNNMVLIEILLGDSRTDCERQDKEGFVPLWHALQNPVTPENINKKIEYKVKPFCSRRICPLQTSS